MMAVRLENFRSFQSWTQTTLMIITQASEEVNVLIGCVTLRDTNQRVIIRFKTSYWLNSDTEIPHRVVGVHIA